MVAGILKKLFLFITVAVTIFSLSAAVCAEPDYTEDGEETVAETADESLISTPIAAYDDAETAAEKVTAAEDNTKNERGDIMSVGGVILTAILVVIINTVISFLVSNRFYKLTQKDSHIQAELRALRRDIDDKFSGNIKQVKEKETRVKNSNPNYSGGESIKAPKTAQTQTDDKEIAEFAKRWNIEIEDNDEPDINGKSPAAERAAYSPERKTRVTEESSTKEKKAKKPKTKSRAKEFMGEIFPFDEDN